MPVEKDEFRRAMSHFAAGVTVVTTVADDGSRHGLTVTAFTSVSLEPPLVLVCIASGAESYSRFRESGVFAVNFLAAGQQEVSRRFATRGTDKFAGVETRTAATGSPLLAGTLGYVDCRTVNAVQAGDHTVLIGEVCAADARSGEPLAYFRGAYGTVAKAADSPAT